MRKVFRVYDDDDNGLISHENLTRCADDLGEDVTCEEIKSMIDMTECGKKNAVSIEDFIRVMQVVGLITEGKLECDDQDQEHEHEMIERRG
jgi:Ca2+-binding EF-hand superfamily protein